MRELRIHREFQRQQARRALGIAPFGGRLLVPQARGAGLDAEILALPQNTDNLEPMNDLTTGGFTALVGISRVGGPDTVG